MEEKAAEATVLMAARWKAQEDFSGCSVTAGAVQIVAATAGAQDAAVAGDVEVIKLQKTNFNNKFQITNFKRQITKWQFF